MPPSKRRGVPAVARGTRITAPTTSGETRSAKIAGLGPPTAEEREALIRVSKVVSIKAVELFSVSAKRALKPKSGTFEGEVTVGGKNVIEGTALRSLVTFRFTNSAVGQFEVAFLAAYELAKPVTQADADVFAKHNIVFNLWPYWRELHQSLSMRMGIGTSPAPLLKM